MRFWPGVGGEGGIGNIRYRFRHGAEGGWRLRPSHGARHGYGDQLGLTFVPWKDDGEARAVLGVEEQAVESVLDVVLGEESRAELGIRVPDAPEYSV
jgi:hypothetical protein